jgi:hypothetical protein
VCVVLAGCGERRVCGLACVRLWAGVPGIYFFRTLRWTSSPPKLRYPPRPIGECRLISPSDPEKFLDEDASVRELPNNSRLQASETESYGHLRNHRPLPLPILTGFDSAEYSGVLFRVRLSRPIGQN